DNLGSKYYTTTQGAWTALAYDCPTVTTTCTAAEGTSATTDAIRLSIPKDGAILHSSNGCELFINHQVNQSPIAAVNPTLQSHQNNGQLAVNITGATTTGIPVFAVQEAGGPS